MVRENEYEWVCCPCGNDWEALLDEPVQCPVCKRLCFFESERTKVSRENRPTTGAGILRMLEADSPSGLQDDGLGPESNPL